MKLNTKFIAVLFVSLWLIACTESISNKAVTQVEQTDSLPISKTDTTVNQKVNLDTLPVGFKRFNVFDMEQNIWLDKPWDIDISAGKITGYKDYNILKTYLVAGWLRLHATDTNKNRYCWVAAIGNQSENSEARVKECYMVLEYEKHTESIPYNVPQSKEYAQDTFISLAFVIQDTTILYYTTVHIFFATDKWDEIG